MTKQDLITKLHLEIGYTKKEAAELLEAMLSLIKSTLESGDTVKISGFGSFDVRQKMDRRGRNPQTGEAITIEARRVLTFKPSAVLKEQINRS